MSRIRNFDEITIKIVNDMPIMIDVEKDYLYRQGEVKGEEKGKIEGMDSHATITVINLLLKTDFPIKQIADLAAVTDIFVKKWEAELEKIQLKTVFNQFGDVKEDKEKTKERSKAMVMALIKIKNLSDEIIGKVADLSEKEVQKFRKADIQSRTLKKRL